MEFLYGKSSSISEDVFGERHEVGEGYARSTESRRPGIQGQVQRIHSEQVCDSEFCHGGVWRSVEQRRDMGHAISGSGRWQ